VVIALALAGAGYGLWRIAGPFASSLKLPRFAQDVPSAPSAPDAGAPAAPTAPASTAEGRIVAIDLFPAAIPGLPSSPDRTPRLALPPLDAVPSVFKDVLARSETGAIEALSSGEADIAITSVVALAAVPQAVRAGVRAVWYLGNSSLDATLHPGCDAAVMRGQRLGAVRASLAHFHLLHALAGEPLPEIRLFNGEEELANAISSKAVTGGAFGTAPRPVAAGTECHALSAAAFALIVLHHKDRPAASADVGYATSRALLPRPSPEEVAAFFDPARRAPGGFAQVFESAGAVWKAAGLIDHPASARDAVDPRFFSPATPAPAPQSAPGALGFPSWPDR